MISAESRDPTATSVGEEQEATRRAEVPASRKRAASADAVGEREAKQMRSPRPLEASSALARPTPGAVGQAKWSVEWAHTRASLGPAPVHNLQRGDAPPAASIVAPRADGHGDSWANQELSRMTPLVKVRGHGS